MPRPGIEGEPQGPAFNEELENSVFQSEPQETSELPDQWAEIKANIIEQWLQLPLEERSSVASSLIKELLGEQWNIRQDFESLSRQDIDELTFDRSAMLPLSEIATLTSTPLETLHSAIYRGRLEAEKRKRKYTAAWYTSLEAVERYRASRMKPQDSGRLGWSRRQGKGKD